MTRAALLIPTCLALILLAGCVKTREIKVGRFQPHSEPAQYTIPHGGFYKVKWKVRDDFKGVDHTTRYLVEGTAVAFENAPDGTLIAIIGGDPEQRVEVGTFPRRAKYACWYHRSKEETQFAIEMREFLEAAAVGSFYVAAITGAVALELWTDEHDDCDRRHWRERKKW
jgi:hypothetical protein